MAVDHHIKVDRTARYWTHGKLNDNTQSIWFVLHGYAQLAEYFIKNFEGLNPEKNFIIAPEGLSRFYIKGTKGRIAASWMTKEDRETEIEDYINYLNRLYLHFKGDIPNNSKINVLGFSQGTATACRWLARMPFTPDNLILWSGFFPKDMKYEKVTVIPKTYILYGDEDPYLKEKSPENLLNILNTNKWPYTKEEFKGSHRIYKECLDKYLEKYNW